MADRYLGHDNGAGMALLVGFSAGAAVGIGLGILFAPKSGLELRTQLSDQANRFANNASEGCRRVSETAEDLADRGRHMYGQARSAVSRGIEEVRQQASLAISSAAERGHRAAGDPRAEA